MDAEGTKDWKKSGEKTKMGLTETALNFRHMFSQLRSN